MGLGGGAKKGGAPNFMTLANNTVLCEFWGTTMEFKVAGKLRQAAVCVHKQHTGRVAINDYVNLACVGAKLDRSFNCTWSVLC